MPRSSRIGREAELGQTRRTPNVGYQGKTVFAPRGTTIVAFCLVGALGAPFVQWLIAVKTSLSC